MKKLILVVFALTLTLSFTSFSNPTIKKQLQKKEAKKEVKNNSLKCILYRTFIGDDSEGCGGGARVCCANTNLNFG